MFTPATHPEYRGAPRLVTVVPLLVFAVLVLAPPSARADGANDAFQAAKALFTAGSYDEAIAALTKAQTDYPTIAADCQRMIGCCYQWKKDYPKAIEAYGKLLTDYPGTEAAAEAYYWIGLCVEAQGNVDEAIAAFEKQIAGFPNSRKAAPAMLKLGERYQDKKLYDLAVEQFNKVLATSPDNAARAQLLIGICLQAQGKYEQAMAELDKVIQSPNGSGSADEARGRKAGCLTQIGIAYQSQEQYEEAIATFSKAIECANGNGSANEARLRIDECLRAQGRYAEELAYLQKLYDEKPDLRSHALIRQSEVLNDGLRDPNGCIEMLSRLVAEVPEDALAKDAQVRIAIVTLYSLNKPEEARELLNEFMAANSTFDNMVEVKYRLAACDYLQRNWSAALAGYRAAYLEARANAWPGTLTFMIADCLVKMGMFGEARPILEELAAAGGEWADTAKDYLRCVAAHLGGDTK